MSHHKTILAHLVGWACSNRHEDAATEGFAYVLSRHAVVRRRFVEVLRAIDARLPDDVRFTTQQAAGAGRVDMAGRSGEALRVIVENKFAAGLTVNQPNGYLAALAATSGATVLVFIAPPHRRDTLWQELIDRVGPERQQTAIGPYCVEITGANGTTRLALLDWTGLLAGLCEGMVDPVAADMTQLVGLCQAAEDGAWWPLEAEELTDRRTPQRMVHYLDIVREATTRAPSTLLSIRSDSNGWGWCGRKLQFAGDGAPSAWLGFSDWRWREYGESPIWLHFEPKYLGLLEVRVRDWCEATGRTFCVNSDGNYLPIRLLTACEQRAVVDHVIEQLTEIHRLLRASGSAATLDRG